jgi:hypothetical protein
MGAAYLSQCSEGDRIAAGMVGYLDMRHVAMGVAGYKDGPYLDFPALIYSFSRARTTVSAADQIGSFFARQIRNATLESSAVKQMPSPAPG